MTDAAATEAEEATGRLDLTQQIRDAILDAQFAPHQRLIEADLSEKYGASRAAVRTARLNLAGGGLVGRLPPPGGRGRGISGVPAVVVEGKYLISGGQPAGVFEEALRKISGEP